MARRVERVEITQDYVLGNLRREAELVGEGSSHSARVRANELLGKHIGIFDERVHHTGGIDINHVPPQDLTYAELRAEQQSVDKSIAALTAAQAGAAAGAGTEAVHLDPTGGSAD